MARRSPRASKNETASRRGSTASSRGLILGAILAYATGGRALYLLAGRNDPVLSYLLHDARRYDEWARAIVSGTAWEAGAYYQAPLYPHLMALVYRILGSDPMVVYVLQALFGVATILLVARITRRAYGDGAAIASAVLMALYGPLVFYETKLLTASLAVMLSALLLDRLQVASLKSNPLQWWLSGLVLGAGALTNPSFLLMAILVGLWIGLEGSFEPSRRLSRTLLFLGGIAVVVAPVTLRNHQVSGDWVLISTNGGLTFAHGNNPNAIGVFSTPPGISGRIESQREESREIAQQATGHGMTDAEVSAFWFRYGLSYLAANPGRAAELAGRKLLLSLANEEQPLEYNQRTDTNPARWLFPMPFALLLGLAIPRLFAGHLEGTGARAETPILLSLLAGGITLVAFYVAGRYRLPSIPALAAVGGAGAMALFDRALPRRRSLGLPLAAAVLVASLSMAYVPLTQADLRRQQEAMAWVDRSAALWETGYQEAAIEALQRSLELDPAPPDRYLSLGRALARSGRASEAERSLREAIRRDPSLATAHFELGLLMIGSGRLEEAAAAFAEAYRLEPGSENAASNLLGTLVHLGRSTEAQSLLQEIRGNGWSVDPELIESVRILESVEP